MGAQSKSKFAKWFEELENGRFKKYAEIMQINGATMQHMPLAGKEGLTRRLEGSGAKFATAEADAKAIFEAFHVEAVGRHDISAIWAAFFSKMAAISLLTGGGKEGHLQGEAIGRRAQRAANGAAAAG